MFKAKTSKMKSNTDKIIKNRKTNKWLKHSFKMLKMLPS